MVRVLWDFVNFIFEFDEDGRSSWLSKEKVER